MAHEAGPDEAAAVWWDTSEAITWIAFRASSPPPLPPHPGPSGCALPVASILEVLAAVAEGRTRRVASGGLPEGPPFMHWREVKRFLRHGGWSLAGVPRSAWRDAVRHRADEVLAGVAAFRQASADQLAARHAADRLLVDAVAAGRLEAFGQRRVQDGPRGWLHAPAGPHEPIPVTLFAARGLSLDGNCIGPRLGSPEWYQNRNRRFQAFWQRQVHPQPVALHPLFINVRVRRADVLRLWKPTPAPAQRRKSKAVSADAVKRAAEALLAQTPPGGRIDREAGLQRLQELTGGNRDSARAAWKEHVPPDRKNPDGAPKKRANEPGG